MSTSYPAYFLVVCFARWLQRLYRELPQTDLESECTVFCSALAKPPFRVHKPDMLSLSWYIPAKWCFCLLRYNCRWLAHEKELISFYLDGLTQVECIISTKQRIVLYQHPWLGKVLVMLVLHTRNISLTETITYASNIIMVR